MLPYGLPNCVSRCRPSQHFVSETTDYPPHLLTPLAPFLPYGNNAACTLLRNFSITAKINRVLSRQPTDDAEVSRSPGSGINFVVGAALRDLSIKESGWVGQAVEWG